MHEKSIHSVIQLLTPVCSVTGTLLNAGMYDHEQMWPPFPQGACGPVIGGG